MDHEAGGEKALGELAQVTRELEAVRVQKERLGLESFDQVTSIEKLRSQIQALGGLSGENDSAKKGHNGISRANDSDEPDSKSAGDRGEAVAAVLLGVGAVAAQIIIIRMDNKYGDGATVTENPLEITDAAASTKTALEGRGRAEEQA